MGEENLRKLLATLGYVRVEIYENTPHADCHCSNCGDFIHCKPEIDSPTCPYWQQQPKKMKKQLERIKISS